MELTLDSLKGELAEYQKSLETKLGEMVKEGASATDIRVKALENQIAEMKTYVNNVVDQMKQKAASTIGGLAEELKHKPFSWTSFIGSLYREAYSGAEGHNDPWREAGYEKEILKTYADKVKTNYATDGSSGGYIIPPEVTDEVIRLVLAAMPIYNIGCKTLTGLRGNLPIPKLTSRPTGYWVGEMGKPTASSAAYGQILLTPKKAAAFTKQSNRLIYQSRGVSDTIIKEEIKNALALVVHQGLVYGTGSDLQPRGVLNWSGTTDSTVSLGSNGGRFTITDAAAMQADLDDANELVDSTGKYGYIMNPRVKSGLRRERVAQYSAQASKAGMPVLAYNPFMSDAMLEELLGYPVKTTTHIPKDNTHGTSSTLSKVIFGNWSYAWLAMWRDLIVKVSDQAGDGSTGSAFLEDQLYIVAMQEVDFALARATAFTIAQYAETTEGNW